MASILVVCTGNVCRSPIAEAALRARLTARFAERAPVVSSAGTYGWEGSPAVPGTIQAAAELGLDVSAHVARALTSPMVDESDLIVCMAAEHRDAIWASHPAEAAARAFTLKELVRLLEQMPPAAADGPDALAARVAEIAAVRRGRAGTHPDQDVADPLGLSLQSFRAVAWEIDEHVARLVTGLFGPGPAT